MCASDDVELIKSADTTIVLKFQNTITFKFQVETHMCVTVLDAIACIIYLHCANREFLRVLNILIASIFLYIPFKLHSNTFRTKKGAL